jgi:hypothetical protein
MPGRCADPATDAGRPASGEDEKGLTWVEPGFRDLSFGVAEDLSHTPTLISCSADGYNPGDAGADSAIEELFRQCASADFPGADTTVAEQWMLGNLANFFEEQRKAPHARAGSSIKEIGEGRYLMETGYLPPYGLEVILNIEGLEYYAS